MEGLVSFDHIRFNFIAYIAGLTLAAKLRGQRSSESYIRKFFKICLKSLAAYWFNWDDLLAFDGFGVRLDVYITCLRIFHGCGDQ